jgi:predicted transcriptional regulator
LIEGRQIRAARGLLEWSRSDLVRASGVSMSALLRLEGAQADTRSSTVTKVVAALEGAGIVLVNEGHSGTGVLIKARCATT